MTDERRPCAMERLCALDAAWSVAGVLALLTLYPAYALLTGLGRRRHAQEYRRLAREAERQDG